jgi:outer membrane protein assembly factor BamB
MGRDGSLYGVAALGGKEGHGVAFRLTPPGSLGLPWTETVLHNFARLTRPQGDGADPASSPIFGSDGGLYGTTRYGGGRVGAWERNRLRTGAAVPSGWGVEGKNTSSLYQPAARAM